MAAKLNTVQVTLASGSLMIPVSFYRKAVLNPFNGCKIFAEAGGIVIFSLSAGNGASLDFFGAENNDKTGSVGVRLLLSHSL
jgi:hypothetical protein